MNTTQVENMLRADCNLATIFEGVFACDRLPLHCDPQTAVVMNLDKHNESGSHWVCLYIENGIGEYFDSYGFPPANHYFVNFLNRNCKRWKSNTQELQALNSDVCGHYCIWFLSERARGKSMTDIVHSFSYDTIKNDKTVKNLVETRFGTIAYNIINNNPCVICQDCIKRVK